MKQNDDKKTITVLIPCHNEDVTVGKVIEDFKNELPDARIIVYDNASTDDSCVEIQKTEAEYFFEKRLGKANVVRRMLSEIKSDVYVLVDADDTYFAKDVHKMIETLYEHNADMVVGRRKSRTKTAMKFVNKLGNKFFSKVMSIYFKVDLKDVLSGYRVFTSCYVENINIMSYEFELEAEMTLQALSKGLIIKEIDVDYKERPCGSVSKLNPLRDGYLVLNTMLALFRDLRPLTFFALTAVLMWAFSLVYGYIIWRLPREANFLDNVVIVCSFLTGWMFILIGFVMHTVDRRFSELTQLMRKK